MRNSILKALFSFLVSLLYVLTCCIKCYAATIPLELKKTVTFIFRANKDGNLKINDKTKMPEPMGTGFFVSVLAEGDKDSAFIYLVTAKHVLQDPEGGIYTNIFVRLNKVGGGFEFAKVSLLLQKVFTSGDPSADVAIIPIKLDPKILDFKTIPVELIASKDKFERLNIAEGSDVFFVGLFTSYYGEKRNNPIVRFGKVAMLPEDKISFGSPDRGWLYLIEAQSYGGNSGSPVFFSLGIDREPNKLFLGPPEIILAGIMKGFFDQKRPLEFEKIEASTQVIPVSSLNSGIAAITPAYILYDLLFSPEVALDRAEWIKKRR